MADAQQTTVLGKLVILAFIAACAFGAWRYFGPAGTTQSGAEPDKTGPGPSQSPHPSPPAVVTLGIAYGTEKRGWFEWAAQEFAKTPTGAGIKLDLRGMGSLEGAQALLKGETGIHVWSPASALYRENFVADWQVKYGTEPIAREELLALTPMVFVWWALRHDAFIKKYPDSSFVSIGQALAERGGWDTIAGKPEWGLFKFGHTHPQQSNSGLATLVLLGNLHHGSTKPLEMKQILDTGFQQWLGDFQRSVTGLNHSTGAMMREMVLKGPSAYDALFVYESVAIDYLKSAEGRWGELRIVYPKLNLWNDNPYYIINAPWVGPEQRAAAESFLAFLMSEPAQKQALVHGFRPGNPQVGVRFPGSPFETCQRFGLRNDLSAICAPPSAEVLANLLQAWQRIGVGR